MVYQLLELHLDKGCYKNQKQFLSGVQFQTKERRESLLALEFIAKARRCAPVVFSFILAFETFGQTFEVTRCFVQ